MKIATWNVDQPNPRSRAIVKHRIRDQIEAIEGVDIWVLTETTCAIDLSQSHPYHLSTRPRLSWRKYQYYSAAIWSRWPIRPVDTYWPEQTVCGLVETSAGPLLVYATIIPYRFAGTKRKMGPLKQWVAHQQAIAAQREDWARLRREQPSIPLCVAGDFNQTLRYSGNRPRQVVDSLRAALDENNLDCLTEGNGRIDHICVSRGWYQTTQLGSWPGTNKAGNRMSDHSGVWVIGRVTKDEE